MSKTFTLNRNGLINFRGKECENQCKETGHDSFKYTVKVTCPNKLDKDGFVINHSLIDEKIQACLVVPTSCEKMCVEIVGYITHLLNTRGVTLIKIYVKVEPVTVYPLAFMEYEVIY